MYTSVPVCAAWIAMRHNDCLSAHVFKGQNHHSRIIRKSYTNHMRIIYKSYTNRIKIIWKLYRTPLMHVRNGKGAIPNVYVSHAACTQYTYKHTHIVLAYNQLLTHVHLHKYHACTCTTMQLHAHIRLLLASCGIHTHTLHARSSSLLCTMTWSFCR